MNSEQITAFLQEHWYIASVLIGAVILIGAIRNWNWLCDPTGTPVSYTHLIGGLAFLSHDYTLDGSKSKTVGDGQHGTARWATKQEIRQTYALSLIHI